MYANRRLESKPRTIRARSSQRQPLVDADRDGEAPSFASNPSEPSNNASPIAFSGAGERRVKEFNNSLREALHSLVEKYANGTASAAPDAALSPLLASFLEAHPECIAEELNQQRTVTTRVGSEQHTEATRTGATHWSAQLAHELRQQQSCTNSASSDTSDPAATSRARSARAALGHFLMPPPYTESPLASAAGTGNGTGNAHSHECPVPLAPMQMPIVRSPPYSSVVPSPPQCEPLTVENLRAFVNQTQGASSTVAPRPPPPALNTGHERIAHSTPGLLRHNAGGQIIDPVLDNPEPMHTTRPPVLVSRRGHQPAMFRQQMFNAGNLAATDSIERPAAFLPSENLDAAERVSSISESSAADLVIDLRAGAIAPNSTPTRLSSNALQESASNKSETCASRLSFPPEPLNPPPTPNPEWSASNLDLSEPSVASADQPIIVNRVYIGPSITPPREAVRQQQQQPAPIAPAMCATRHKESPESGVLHVVSPSSSLYSLSEQSPAHQAAAHKALQDLIAAGARASPGVGAKPRSSSHNVNCGLANAPKLLVPAESARQSRSHSRGALEVDLLLPTPACFCAQHSPAACSSCVEPAAAAASGEHKHKRTKRDAMLKTIARARALGLNESSSSSSSSALPNTELSGQTARLRVPNRPYRRVRLSFFTSVPPPTPHASESDSTSETQAPVVTVAPATVPKTQPQSSTGATSSSHPSTTQQSHSASAPSRSKLMSRSRNQITQPLRFKVAGCPFPLAREYIGEEQCETALELDSSHVLFPAGAVVSPGWSSASATTTTGPSSGSLAVSSATGPRGESDRLGECSTSPLSSSFSQSIASASSPAPSSAQSATDRTAAAPPFPATVGRSTDRSIPLPLPVPALMPIANANSQSSRAPRDQDHVIEIARL